MWSSLGSAAAPGNSIASCYLAYGASDGSNEANDHANVAYRPTNPPTEPGQPGNPNIVDLDRWQQTSLSLSIDQAGNPVNRVPEFLSPEWGSVAAFALTANDLTTYNRDGYDYHVYHDPGPPPSISGSPSFGPMARIPRHRPDTGS
jgi:hypothetical protein